MMIIFLCLAIDLIRHRQKLLQLANSSELGWQVVTEYKTNSLASGSDDEKRIYKDLPCAKVAKTGSLARAGTGSSSSSSTSEVSSR